MFRTKSKQIRGEITGLRGATIFYFIFSAFILYWETKFVIMISKDAIASSNLYRLTSKDDRSKSRLVPSASVSFAPLAIASISASDITVGTTAGVPVAAGVVAASMPPVRAPPFPAARPAAARAQRGRAR